jgi:hypothetical protein
MTFPGAAQFWSSTTCFVLCLMLNQHLKPQHLVLDQDLHVTRNVMWGRNGKVIEVNGSNIEMAGDLSIKRMAWEMSGSTKYEYKYTGTNREIIFSSMDLRL